MVSNDLPYNMNTKKLVISLVGARGGRYHMDGLSFSFNWDDIERYANMHIMTPVLIVNSNEIIINCNQYFNSVTGYDKHQVIGSSVHKIMDFGSTIPEEYDQLTQTNTDSSISKSKIVCIQTAWNHQICFEYFILRSTSPHQKEDCYLITLRQIRDAAQQLFQRFSKAFLHDVNLGVMLINTEFRLVEISDMACTILGMEKDAIAGRPMEEVFASVPIEYQLVQRTILDGLIVRNHAISWTSDQKKYDLLLDSNVLRDDEGNIVGAYIIFKDVTNLRSLEEQVQRSDRLSMIGQIAAGTAHEIRNPLTSIKGFLQMFRKTFQANAMQQELGYVDVMLTEIERVNELVNEFLLLSKQKGAKLRPIDITHVLLDILPIIRSEALLYRVQMNYIPAPNLPEVIADKEMLKQVFLNICKNGIEAMADTGGILTITEKVGLEDRNIYIEIQDSGPGIPYFLMDKIFDPFFTTKDSGTGLGLSVCQRIIHDLGGHIRVASKGFGTTFTICIPYQ